MRPQAIPLAIICAAAVLVIWAASLPSDADTVTDAPPPVTRPVQATRPSVDPIVITEDAEVLIQPGQPEAPEPTWTEEFETTFALPADPTTGLSGMELAMLEAAVGVMHKARRLEAERLAETSSSPGEILDRLESSHVSRAARAEALYAALRAVCQQDEARVANVLLRVRECLVPEGKQLPAPGCVGQGAAHQIADLLLRKELR